MGNGLSQVGNVSGAVAPSVPANNGTSFNSGFNTMVPNALNAGIPKDYSNDMMAPDWLKTGNITDAQRTSIFGAVNNPTAQAQYPQQVQYAQQTQNPSTTVFGGQNQPQQPQYTYEQQAMAYEQLLAQNPNLRVTEKGNIYEISNSGKKTGIFVGIGTALASGISKLFKGEAFKNAFNLKSLAIKLPIFVVTGWAVGSLIDAFSNSNKAKQADAQA